MSRMHNPPHPGEILADTVLREEGGFTLTEFAKRLDVSRVALSRVVNGRAAVSPELAMRLSRALGGTAESWLNMQAAYDLWVLGRRPGLFASVKRLFSIPPKHVIRRNVYTTDSLKPRPKKDDKDKK
jgi:addiction module HigA family antidote